MDALLRDMAIFFNTPSSTNLKTVFIGGGTPNELPLPELDRLLAFIAKRGHSATLQHCNSNAGDVAKLQNDTEWTIEVNPQSFTRDCAEIFARNGVNRISFGFQSASDDALKRLGRMHRHSDNIQAVAIAKDHGFKNLSGDMIFGIAEDAIEETAAFMAESGMTHVSAYELTIEGRSTWSLKKFDPSVFDDDKLTRLARVVSALDKHGYGRYEVSNFARPGFECRSHLNVWRSGEYAGVGSGAHGFENSLRYANTDSFEDYIENGSRCSESVENLAAETMLLGMRMPRGIRLDELSVPRRDALLARRADLDSLARDGYVEFEDDVVRPTEKGLLFVNDISLRMV